ncbi:MAG: hypothetical protein AB2L14_31720 [Candidatus Xenobiia bacterium LiM19]
MKNEINNKAIAVYNKSVEKHGISHKSVLWGNKQSQYYRFYELTRFLDLNNNNKSLLDVGCGNCELYNFLNCIGYRGSYTGFDINDLLIKQAKMRFNKIDAQVLDIMNDNHNNIYSYVVMSGVFNVDYGQSLEWIHKFIIKMYSYCNDLLIFNSISTHVNYFDKNMYYLDPSEILTFCIENLTKRITLLHHNLPYNFTVIAYRDSEWQANEEVLFEKTD